MFSKACEYGIRATLYVAMQSMEGQRAGLREIVDVTGTPAAYMAKILQKLVHAGILDSVRGPVGGFGISRIKIDNIRLAELVHTLEGDRFQGTCLLGKKSCGDTVCPLHNEFLEMKEEMLGMLENTSLFELASQLSLGLGTLKYRDEGET
ncbi:MAG: Rrf2 family transcriptional regulator [Cyclobacteriaceae bacterium]|nr:Rrf2 family transcriptional regulator [Cyclobacteriaceae bacterium]